MGMRRAPREAEAGPRFVARWRWLRADYMGGVRRASPYSSSCLVSESRFSLSRASDDVKLWAKPEKAS